MVKKLFNGESRRHVQKFGRWVKRRENRKGGNRRRKGVSLFDVSIIQKRKESRIRARLPIDGRLATGDGADR